MNKFFKNVLFYLLIIMVIIWMFDLYGEKNSKPADISYTSFMQHVQQDEIKQVTIVDNVISGKLKDGKEFSTVAPNDSKLVEKLEAKKVDIKAELPPQPPWWMSILSSILPMLIIVGLWFMLMNQGGAGGGKVMNFGKSRARRYDEEKLKITFKDVAGAEEAKQELEEVVEFLKHPQKYNDLGAKIPKGVLLYGPPGTGKTLLAKAVAGEAGVPFFSISGSDFVEMFVGVGASRVRDLFDQAKKSAPCIVFIDEIDAVGRQRGAGLGGGHDEREQTLNQLLVEMDGFSANEGVIVIAATNRKDILDPALLRPGRFDRQIYVGAPDWRGRAEILQVHARKKPLADNVDLPAIAKATAGFTGADLANLLNEGALLAARNGKAAITQQDLEAAMIKVIAGPEKKSRVVSHSEKMLTAVHEAGHAVCMYCLDSQDPVHLITIIPRAQAGGMTISLPQDDKSYASRNEMFETVVSFLGGRVAEALKLCDISTGASNDLQRATKLARDMVATYGMSDAIGPVSYSSSQEVFIGRDYEKTKPYSEATAGEIDVQVQSIMREAYKRCEEILTAHSERLDKIAGFLMENENMNRAQFEAVMQDEALDAPKS